MADSWDPQQKVYDRRMMGCLAVVLLLIIVPMGIGMALAKAVNVHFRSECGRDPLSREEAQNTMKVQKGWTQQEVMELLGKPHQTSANPNGGVSWIYWYDSLTTSYFGIEFDAKGKVVEAHDD